MATTKNMDKPKSLKISFLVDPTYQCDICKSDDLVETREGFTCRACGIVLEVQKLEYHRPYDADVVQHAVLSKTQIGFKSERRKLQYSTKLEGLSRIDASRSTEENVILTAKVEIKRILTALGFSLNDLDVILSKFKENRANLGKGTKYRSAEMLVPCVIYAYYKEKNKPIREKDLLEVSKISKKDFNAFKFSIIRIWPEYQERDRKTSITLLCSQKKEVSVCAICDRLGIKMSTIHRQVERRVIQRFNVPGFKTLVKSAELLKKVMGKLGVLDQGFIDPIEVSKNSLENDDIVQLILGNARQVFNSLNRSEEHFFIVKEASGYLVASIANKQDNLNTNHKLNFEEFYDSDKNEIYDAQEPVKVELWKFHNPKGPPVLC